MRECSHCHKQKPLDDRNFRPVKGTPHFRHKCRRCEAGDSTERRRGVLSTVSKRAQRVEKADGEEPSFDIDVDPLAAAYLEREQRDERRESKKQINALLDEVTRLKAQAAELVRMRRAPEAIVYKKGKEDRSDAIACAIASDWHVEEGVDLASVNGLNEYSPEIARARSEAFFRNLLRLAEMMARESKINTIYIAALGDFFSGFIHDELIAGNAMAPGDAARFFRGLFIAGIDFLLRESTFEIEVDAIPGNHGRMTKKIWFSDPTGTSLETFAYHAIAGRYDDNPRVRFHVASQAIVYRDFFERFKLRLLHGYEVRYGGGVGGLTIPLRKAISRWDKGIRADLSILGHFHQRFDGGDFLVNGSLIGFNNYAQANGFSPEEAQQSFFLIHARNGGQKSIVAPIWLDDAHRQNTAA